MKCLAYTCAAVAGGFLIYTSVLMYIVTQTFVNSFGEDFQELVHNLNMHQWLIKDKYYIA